MAPDLEESFDTFVRARGEHFLRVAVLLTGAPAEAEDLLQASLVRLYRAWPRLSGQETAPDAYLRKILVNTRRSWWGTKWRRESPVADVPDRPHPASQADPADEYATGALVRSALAGLPRQQRAVLVLRYIEDLPAASVAELLGISVGSVKTHAHRGLRALRESLGELGPVAIKETAGPDGAKG
jgi:RNA polymerase sigma-70 factor (sigma-E family)